LDPFLGGRSLEFESNHVQGILTGKLFEYLFAGPPILSIGVGSDSSVNNVLKATERGESFGNNIISLSQKIQELLAAKMSRETIYKDFYDTAITQYSRKTQAEKLIGLLSEP